MSTLSLKKINKIYPNDVQAVFDFNLDIKDKEFIVFVGPSGCGKSTTLRMVAGLEDITFGELYIDGKLMNDVAPKDRHIAMVFQSYALYPHMSVFDNMAFALKLRKRLMPLYEKSEEYDQKLKEMEPLWAEIRAINKRYKKNQNDLTILAPREKLYSDLYKAVDAANAVRKPKVGIDEYQIKTLTKKMEKLKKELVTFAKRQEKQSLEEVELALIKEGIAQREEEIARLEKQIQFYRENEVELKLPRHMNKREIEIEVNKTAESIDLVRYLYRKPAALSGGQRQRVALGRAIVRKPKVFLMDEPLSNLDAKLRVQTRSEISKIHNKVGATTIYVTHDQTEAMTMADRIVIMKDGYIQQIGTPEEVYDDPSNKFVGGFIGNPAMNFLAGHYEKGVFEVAPFKNDINSEEIPVGLTGCKIKLNAAQKKILKDYDGKDVIFGIRPEAIYLEGDGNNPNPSKPIALECDYAELLGYELILYSYIEGQKLICKTSVKNKVTTGSKFSICLNQDAMYFFDAETEARIK